MRDRTVHLRLGVEGLRDDRLALRLDGRAGGGHRRLQRAPEPLDLERLLDHAEGRRRGAHRAAGVRHGDARRVPPPPRPAVRLADGRSAAPAASSRRARSTCSPTSPSSCRRTASAPPRSSRRRCSTRRTWRSRRARRSTRPGFFRALVRDVDGGAASAARERILAFLQVDGEQESGASGDRWL